MDEATQFLRQVASVRREAIETHRQAQQVLAHLALLAMETTDSEDAARHLLAQYGSFEQAINYIETAQVGLGKVLTSWALQARHQSRSQTSVTVNV